LPWRIHPSGYEDCFWISDDWTDNFFHFLFDALPRLLALRKGLGTKPLLLPAVCKQRSYITEILSLLEQEVVYLQDDHRYFSAKRLHYCDTSGERYFRSENFKYLNELKSVLLRDLPASDKTLRLYVSRSQATIRRVLNEDELLEPLSEAGFQIVFLEQLTVAQQVALFAQAEWVIAPHGAGLANLAFAPKHCRVLELRAAALPFNSLYQNLCRNLDHIHEFFDCDTTGTDCQSVDYRVSVDDFLKQLRRA